MVCLVFFGWYSEKPNSALLPNPSWHGNQNDESAGEIQAQAFKTPPSPRIINFLLILFSSESDSHSKWLLTLSPIYLVPAFHNSHPLLSRSYSLHLFFHNPPPPSGLAPRCLGGLPPFNLLTRDLFLRTCWERDAHVLLSLTLVFAASFSLYYTD